MQKNVLIIAAVITASLMSCKGGGGSFESDVRKSANYMCEMSKLAAADPSDEKSQKKLADLKKEKDEFEEKMREKYKDKKDDKEMEEKGGKIMKEVMDKCK